VVVEKHERFALFVNRLMAAPCARSAEEAYLLLGNTLNALEDELSGIPLDPSKWASDGRMYPPQSDNARDVAGRPELTRYRSLAHNTYISESGAIRIEKINRDLVLSKPACNGNEVQPP
jgi:hypothetical protein